jgi:hypothetical protein
MKGTVLGADAVSGTISGDDGKRYKFALSEWKSDRTPYAGDEVDFEIADDGRAIEVFRLRGSAPVDFGEVGDQAKQWFDRGVSSPVGGLLLKLLKSDLTFQISVVTLLASLFLTYVYAGGAASEIATQSYKLIGMAGFIDAAKTSLDAAASSLDASSQVFGGFLQQPVAQSAGSASSALRAVAAASTILYLLYLVPLGATLIIVQMLRGRRLGVAPLATGVACICSFLLLLALRFVISERVSEMGLPPGIAEAAAHAVGIGFGSYVIAACGLGLVAVSLGFVKTRVPA